MTRYVALLRGINVGGNKLVPMARLRALLQELGCTDIATLLQSGNAVFTSKVKNPAELEARIAAATSKTFGFGVEVIVRTRDELAAVLADNPFPGSVRDPAKFLVVFLSRPADPTFLAGLPVKPPEALRERGRELYALLPNGIGRSKLAQALMKPRKGVIATGRNWATLTKLLALADRSREHHPG